LVVELVDVDVSVWNSPLNSGGSPQTDNDCDATKGTHNFSLRASSLPLHVRGQRSRRDFSSRATTTSGRSSTARSSSTSAVFHSASSKSVTVMQPRPRHSLVDGHMYSIDLFQARTTHLRVDVHADAERLRPHGHHVRDDLRRRIVAGTRSATTERTTARTAAACPAAWRARRSAATPHQNPPEKCDDRHERLHLRRSGQGVRSGLRHRAVLR